jgi:hypothetical protein
MSAEQQRKLKAYQTHLEYLVRAAKEDGVVLTIDIHPCEPLAMGHVIMVPNTRPARGHY